jgi:hypothetical protein
MSPGIAAAAHWLQPVDIRFKTIRLADDVADFVVHAFSVCRRCNDLRS